MKLLIKIFFQTTCIILLVSSGIFLYTTYCWKNQSIQNINSYESSIFRTNILQFENKTSLSDNQKQNADNEMRPQIVTYAFRQVFHDSAVLYLDGKMTYNGTVYEFDVKKLRELCKSKANMVDHGSNSDGHGPMVSQINGRTLLLFYYGNVNMGYQIVTYKDITDESKPEKTKAENSSLLVATGQTTPVCNIYDMGGNVWEWTTESWSDTDIPYAIRGGFYGVNFASRPAGVRYGSSGGAVTNIGFRLTLFM